MHARNTETNSYCPSNSIALSLRFVSFFFHVPHQEPSEPEEPPQSIYLEGALPHESQILVADSETVTEGVYDEELNGNADEPAVVFDHSVATEYIISNLSIPIHLHQVILSSKMTLSLINLDPIESNGHGDDSDAEVEGSAESDIEEEEDDDDEHIRNLHGDGIDESDS